MIDKILMKEMLFSGKTLQTVATHFNVSRQRIQQLVKKEGLHRDSYGCSLQKIQHLKRKEEELLRLYNRKTYSSLSDLEKAQGLFFSRKKQNTKNTKWEWEIVMSDLVWHTHCPILGVELDWFAEKRQENSPSIDRIDSTKGYVKGNVQIMSWRANRIKNDGTAEEHRKIADWLQSLKEKT